MINCKYLKDTDCLSIQENVEAKAARKVACENKNEKACCYLCDHYSVCEISCDFLGENKNPKTVSKVDNKKINVERCPKCDSKMHYAIVNLRVGGWEGVFNVLPVGALGTIQEELLPVKVYVCSKCGKMEFYALEKTKQKIINEMG